MAKWKNVSTLNTAKLSQFRTLIDQFISKPNDNPVTEHKNAGMDMSLMRSMTRASLPGTNIF